MRILHLLNHIQNIGNGIVNVATDLACLQSQSGHVVAIAAGQKVDYSINIETYEALLARYGVKHFVFEQTRTPRSLFLAIGRYRQIIRDFQPDIVHVHMMTGVVLAKVLRSGFAYRIVSTIHNEFQRSAALMGLADKVIAVSQAVATAMTQRGIAPHKIEVIQNGTIGSPRQQPMLAYEPLPLQRPAITTVAGLYARKGIRDLIEGFDQVAASGSSAHLYIVGDGADRPQLEAQAQASSFAHRIHFEGFQLEPQRYLRSTDVFVLASLRDPCPLVISEAREAGCAIVASQVDGIPEALDGGDAGLLTDPGNSASIAAALRQLLEDSACLAHWRQMAQKDLANLSATRVHEETLELYKSCLLEEIS